MEVKKGYQMTELGQIPSDWRAVRFEDVLTGFASGATPYRGRPEYYKGSIRWITSGELNYNTITDTVEKITEEAVRNTNLKMLPVGTFLMAITGLEAAGTRGSCGIVGKESTTNQSCMALMPKNGEITTEYLYHFYVKYGDELAFRYCQGTKQQSYTGKIVKILPINLPPTLTEQRAIATALSDVDALIAALEGLIAKKKAIKQGAMQELLKPKERWVSKKLGEIAEVVGGGTPSTFIPQYWNGMINWFTPTEIGSEKYVFESNRKITKEGMQSCSAKILPIGTILLTTRAGIGDVSILMNEGCTNQGFQSLIVKEGYCNEYFYYLILTMKNVLIQNASGSTFLEISPSKIKQIETCIPNYEEQTQIAQILTDMDAGIAALERQRDKYKAVKAGMMQELLTGKTRLV